MQEDIETAFGISSITLELPSDMMASYAKEISLSMANVENDILSETFSENYLPGSLVEVFYLDSLFLTDGTVTTELVLELDTPFFYNGVDNLLIDFYYPDGSCWCGNYGWNTGTARCVYNKFYPGTGGGPTGLVSDWIPYMVLEGTQSLEQNTFGAVKVILGGDAD
ncbi:MAG: hypothetical protein B1H09_05185 [Gemmatimonadaceae bacterium 4484_173]|nr:MAG: hypothetical protein B1H09_05185 [Gemmatimonadaceae bacterium 4484_173]RKZ03813.1 MAG: hypothetical protein DRQ21_04735 [Candidatus Fermentibacteria bacterium]